MNKIFRVTLLIIVLIINVIDTYAQVETLYREAYTLKLHVDKEQFYEQKVEKTPYFVKEKILQIYPGEKIFIEVERTKKIISSMKIVKENLNPEKTIEVELNQMITDSICEGTMLKISNPFKHDLQYEAMMFIVGHNQWIKTTVIPVKSKLSSYETWKDVIITIVLSEWKLK